MNERTDTQRKSDEVIIRLEQKFIDHDEWEKAFFKDIRDRVVALETFRNIIEKPALLAGKVFMVFFLSLCSGAAVFVWKAVIVLIRLLSNKGN